METIRFENPREVAEFILTIMQEGNYPDRMSSYYSRCLVQALVQASHIRKTINRPSANDGRAAISLSRFIAMSNEEQKRVLALNSPKDRPHARPL